MSNALLICAMEKSPSWEANRFLASQEISRILWNLKIFTTFTNARHLPHPEPDQSNPCFHILLPIDPS